MSDGFTNGPLLPQAAKATPEIANAINNAMFLMGERVGTFMGEV